jgi:beta-glucoside operon transcriptional antiterminator
VQVIKEYPDAYRCALRIRDYVKAQLDITLGGNELLWLTVHLVRIAGWMRERVLWGGVESRRG